MGFIGGKLAYEFLRWRYPSGQGIPMSQGDPYNGNKLMALFGPDIFEELRGKTVLDFGCGTGGNAIELARQGCRVIGLDIQEHFLEIGRKQAEKAGVADRCTFSKEWREPVDVVLSMDAFEHFSDPAGMLAMMKVLLKPDGYILLEFGPTWYHPLGGHLFSVFPWAHLIFTEKALIRWRQDFKTDGATRFHEVAGGLNQITIQQWEAMVRQSGLAFKSYELKPIRQAKGLHCGPLREYLTALVRARLVVGPAAAAQQ